MALYTGAATYRTEDGGALKLTGSGVRLTHLAAANGLEGALLVDVVDQVIGEVEASIAEDNPSGTRVLFSAQGSAGNVLAALRRHRASIDAN